ncbi:DoxX family membrane protein [Chishuiella sp.]|uniref:DoxX family membrane protein n=1 Tax=Chishuiella sp. TaxID=1969467 RepID=UPI0028ADEB72|nr:DoxX family membrane protein [Chishuiella sp.]
MTKNKIIISQLLLRFALAITMLSAVADRLSLWKNNSTWGNWKNFELYTKQLIYFVPEKFATICAYTATFLEIVLSVMLIIGYKIRLAAYITSLLLLSFSLAMTISFGIKTSFDYSVWIGFAASFLLANQIHHFITIDNLFKKKL